MAEGAANGPLSPLQDLSTDEWERLQKRRDFVKNYQPPIWRSRSTDLVSGAPIEKRMVEHASILILSARFIQNRCTLTLLLNYHHPSSQ